jgi:hypothetical protein
MAKPTVYIETTIISYLTSRPSRDVIRAAQQRLTHDWWDTQRGRFELVTSELVAIECAAGDSRAATERLDVVGSLSSLEVTDVAKRIAEGLVAAGAIPDRALRDTTHVGVCAANGIAFLLTWNFRHLANAQMQPSILEVCASQGYRPPTICAPDALFEVTP